MREKRERRGEREERERLDMYTWKKCFPEEGRERERRSRSGLKYTTVESGQIGVYLIASPES